MGDPILYRWLSDCLAPHRRRSSLSEDPEPRNPSNTTILSIQSPPRPRRLNFLGYESRNDYAMNTNRRLLQDADGYYTETGSNDTNSSWTNSVPTIASQRLSAFSPSMSSLSNHHSSGYRNQYSQPLNESNCASPNAVPRHVQPDPNVSVLSSPSISVDTSKEEREQALRDYKVTIEYKHLKSHAPGGVYLIPSLHDLRHFHGIIFVRRGPYTNGIFKFQLVLPAMYNDHNTHPRILFHTINATDDTSTSPKKSSVYNPHVDPITGELDVVTSYPTWDPSKHYLVTVLTFLKKIFYAKTFDEAKANPEAKQLFTENIAEYRKKVDECVRESQKNVFVNSPQHGTVTPQSPSSTTSESGGTICTAKFTEEQLSHRVLRDLLKANVKDPSQVSKQAILTMIDKASKV